MEGHCSTGQSRQWAVVPMEEGGEEGEERKNEEDSKLIWTVKSRHIRHVK